MPRSRRSRKSRVPDYYVPNKPLRKLQSEAISDEFHAVESGDYVPTAKTAEMKRKQLIAIGLSRARRRYHKRLSRRAKAASRKRSRSRSRSRSRGRR